MNQEFVSKIIKAIIKILKSIKIKKKSMPENNIQPTQPVVATIRGNTQIIFTVKSFFATLGSILGLFISFYFLVVVPRQEKTEEYQKELYEQQQVYITEEFEAVNSGLSKNNDNIEDLTKRFNDLNTAVESIANSSGGFGNNTTSPTTSGTLAVGVSEIALASNED